MKFSFFQAVIICSSLHFVVAQYGNYEFEVYEQDPNTGAIRPVQVPTQRPRTTTSRYQNYEVYEYDPSTGAIKPVAAPNRRTTKNYQNNIFLNPNTQNTQHTPTTKQPTMSLTMNSCDTYWTLMRDYNGYFGQLSIPSPNQQEAIIRVFLTVGTVLPTQYVGKISLAKDRQSTVRDVANGLPILYRINFPVQNPIPKLTGVYYNNQLLCRGQKDTGEIVTTIALDHTLYTGLAQMNYQNNPNAFTQTPTQPTSMPTSPPITSPSVTQPPTTRAPIPTRPSTEAPYVFPNFDESTTANKPQPTASSERFNEFNSQCGVPQYQIQDSTGLVVRGKEAIKGQFPWLTAYYHNDIGETGFICGGSLVSSKVVITAAHCIHNKREDVIRQPDQALIYLGKYFLQSQPNERGFLVSGATKFVTHPDWSAYTESFDGDIAAIVLLRKIQFSDYIRPICIWTSTQSYSDIVNKQGIVVGYGKTEFTAVASDKPYWAELPVVDESTCLRSNNVFNKITSNRTFCAGSRDGRGPCNGDSGGGFVMKSGDKWYLRGIVSSALFDKEMFMCDTRNYAVFTDVAVFKDWILNHIEIYG